MLIKKWIKQLRENSISYGSYCHVHAAGDVKCEFGFGWSGYEIEGMFLGQRTKGGRKKDGLFTAKVGNGVYRG